MQPDSLRSPVGVR